mmetsp:Transcript_14237/g.16187  ORF Transcript_14237/g.16187 Transcript_14237/m.16187 type:complete len:384 (+) Transcript_14237:158-1309(+)
MPSFHADLDKWHALSGEEAIEKDLEIYDPHLHFWDPLNEPRGPLTFLSRMLFCSKTVRENILRFMFPSAIQGLMGTLGIFLDPYLPSDYFEDMGDHNITKTVHIETVFKKEESYSENASEDDQEKLHYAAMFEARINKERGKVDKRVANALVAHLNLKQGRAGVQQKIKDLKEVNANLRGIRHQGIWHESKTIADCVEADKEMFLSDAFIEGCQVLEEMKLSFDAYIYHTQLSDLDGLAKALPNLRIVLNHIGQPLGYGVLAKDKESTMTAWKESITTVAKNENVFCKLSGIMCACGWGFERNKLPPTSEEVVKVIKPYFQHCIDEFGVDRCMFASNFPVDKSSVSGVVVWNAYKKLCNELGISEDEKVKLFKTNASSFYSIN